MKQTHLKLTIKTPAWPRISFLSNVVYMLSILLTLNTFNVMCQYIFQFRQICVVTKHINLPIKHIFLSCQPLSAWHLKLFHQHELATLFITVCMFLSCQERVSEWIRTLLLHECQGASRSKQERYLKLCQFGQMVECSFTN